LKKTVFLVIVGLLLIPLVAAGAGYTKMFSFANVDNGYLEYSELDYIYGKGYENLEVINVGDSTIATTAITRKSVSPNLEKWEYVDVSPMVCPQPVDPYKAETIGWGSDGEAYMHTLTYTEDDSHVKDLEIYGKGGGGTDPSTWNSAGLIVASEGKGFTEFGYKAIGEFCTNIDQDPGDPTDPPSVPTPPERPDCPFCDP
jgi:hypothetical protein